MQVTFLDAEAVTNELKRLIKWSSKISVAVAWAKPNETLKHFSENRTKIHRFFVGLTFCGTDPKALAELEVIDGARLVTKAEQGTFHPKVYYFESEDAAAAIVGSSNLTDGGLGGNTEACLLIEAAKSEAAFREIRRSIDALESQSETLDADILRAYEAKYKASQKLRRPPHDPISSKKSRIRRISSSSLVHLKWSDLAKEYDEHGEKEINRRLKLLEQARSYFTRAGKFNELSMNERKAVAGYLESNFEGVHWLSFGSMKGAGYFKRFVAENNEILGKAVDAIPLKGDVTYQHYEEFLIHFEQTFDGVDRKGGLATASRLLAIKRPDIFVCVCKPNKQKISERLAIRHTCLDLSNYWDWVVEPIRGSVWYNADRPSSRIGARIWNGRAAMLDTLFYDP